MKNIIILLENKIWSPMLMSMSERGVEVVRPRNLLWYSHHTCLEFHIGRRSLYRHFRCRSLDHFILFVYVYIIVKEDGLDYWWFKDFSLGVLNAAKDFQFIHVIHDVTERLVFNLRAERARKNLDQWTKSDPWFGASVILIQ